MVRGSVDSTAPQTRIDWKLLLRSDLIPSWFHFSSKEQRILRSRTYLKTFLNWRFATHGSCLSADLPTTSLASPGTFAYCVLRWMPRGRQRWLPRGTEPRPTDVELTQRLRRRRPLNENIVRHSSEAAWSRMHVSAEIPRRQTCTSPCSAQFHRLRHDVVDGRPSPCCTGSPCSRWPVPSARSRPGIPGPLNRMQVVMREASRSL